MLLAPGHMEAVPYVARIVFQGLGNPTETGTTFSQMKNNQMDVVWFGAQSTTGSYFCKGIGLPRHHGAFLSLGS